MANEKRLIDLDELIETLKATKVSECYPYWNDMTPLGKAVVYRAIRAYREILLKQPAIDAVEVVRCKDCQWWNKVGCAIRINCDEDKPTENDFCSYGEKREGGTQPQGEDV